MRYPPRHRPLAGTARSTCTICEMAFTKIMKARSITTDVTVMFAELRGYTALTQDWPVERLAARLDTFYDACGAAIWKHDGLLNKTLGDSVLAIFNFPLRHGDYAAGGSGDSAALSGWECRHDGRHWSRRSQDRCRHRY
jgi:class 3 adenylate cyclase